MNKLVKLVLVNLMGILNYNNIIKEVESGIKGKNETRAVLVAIVSLFYGYFLYFIFNLIGDNLTDKSYIYFVGFILASIICFVVSFIQVGPIIFKSEDSEYLFSLPLSKHQIIFSKLFNVYIRNIFYVLIVMIPCILSYCNFSNINETIALLYIICCLAIPFIPILFSVVSYYFYYLLKFKLKKILFLIVRFIVIVGLLFFLYLFISGIDYGTISILLDSLYERFRVIYPTSFLFVRIVNSVDVISFIIYIIINVLSIIIYMCLISNKYRSICSMLKGIRINKKFKYKNNISLGNKLGLLRKEILFVLKNKLYFKNSYGILMTFSIIFILGILFVDVNDLISNIDDFYQYYNIYCPFILAGIVSFGNSTINSISLEKSSIDTMMSLPIKFKNIIFYKWLCNVVICSLFILFNGTILNIVFKPNVFVIITTYLLPLFVVMFISLLSIMLDYRFVIKNEVNDGNIIKQRFISLVPMLISFLIIMMPVFINVFILYKNVILTFMLVCLILMLIISLYMFINRKKLRRNLFN